LSDRGGNILSGEIAETASQIFLEPTEHFREGFFIDGMAATEEAEEANAAQRSDGVSVDEAEEERRARLRAYLLGDEPVKTAENPLEKPFVSVKEAKNRLVDQVIEIIDEKISFKEANIILGFSGNDIERIKRKYRIAKMSQVSDTISVLINELQKPESGPAAERLSNVIKADVLDDEEPTDRVQTTEHMAYAAMADEETALSERLPKGTQVNAMQILRMQAYQKQKKGPKK
jgi:hypothetical protein